MAYVSGVVKAKYKYKNASSVWVRLAPATRADNVEFSTENWVAGLQTKLGLNVPTNLEDALEKIAEMLGAANGIATLDSSGVLPYGQIPAEIRYGLQFQAMISGAQNIKALTIAGGDSGGQAVVDSAMPGYKGNLWICNGATTLTAGTSSYFTVTCAAPGDENDYDLSDGIALESGDMVVIGDYNGTTHVLTVHILNLSWNTATSAAFGVVKLGSAVLRENLDSSGEEVVTEPNLRAILIDMDSDIATLLSGKEPVFSKNSAFNKNWAGSSGNYGTADTPARSDHLHAGAVSETGTQTLTNKTLTEPIILTNGAPTFGNTKGKMGVYDTGTAVEFYFGTGAAVRTLLDNNNWPTKIPKITISADGNPAGDEQIGSIMIDLSA